MGALQDRLSASGSSPGRRAGSLRGVWLAALVSVLVAAPAAGQVPTDTLPADTVPGDTLLLPVPPEGMVGDTLPADSLRPASPDSLVAAPRLPALSDPFPTGFGAARWEWGREELLRFHSLSLLELLEDVPGLVVTRTGGFGRPAGVAFLDTGGGRVRLFRDGFEVDPLASAIVDLQHVAVGDLEAVRVERTPGQVRIELSTFQLDDRRPFSRVEAGTGNFEAKILRAIFSRPVGGRSVVTGAYDLAATDGFTASEPFSFGSGRLRWTYAHSERAGLQAEYRIGSVERGGDVFAESTSRREVFLRGRVRPLSGLTVDALVGRSSRTPSDSESGTGVGDRAGLADPFTVGLSSTQVALRAAYERGPGYLEAAARVRDGDAAGLLLPRTELSGRGVFRPLAWAAVEGEVGVDRRGGGQVNHLLATARLGPFRGLSVFGSVGGGERWVGTLGDTLELRLREDSVVVGGVPQPRADSMVIPVYGSRRADAGSLRAGAEWAGRGATLGAAFVSSAATLVVPYALPFDYGVAPVDVGAASGFEANASIRLPFWWPTLRLQGWYASWMETGDRPYLPSQQAKAALEFHGVFVDGEFEPTLRVEALYRGSALTLEPDGSGYGPLTEPYSMTNLFLQIRILDVRAFVLYENVLNNRTAEDVPGFLLAGPRTMFGVRWHFRN